MLSAQFFRDWYFIQYSNEQEDLEKYGYIRGDTKKKRENNPELELINGVNACFGGSFNNFINSIENFNITERSLEKNSNLNKFIEKRIVYCFNEGVIKIPESGLIMNKKNNELGLTQTEVTEIIGEHEKKINTYR